MANPSDNNYILYPTLPREETSQIESLYPRKHQTSMEMTPIEVTEVPTTSSPGPERRNIFTVPLTEDDIKKFGQEVEKRLTTPPAVNSFGLFSVLSIFITIGNFMFNVGTDIAVVYMLHWEHDTEWWFWFSLALVVIPNVMINAFSYYWYVQDDQMKQDKFNLQTSATAKVVRIIMHCFIMGTILRCFDTLCYGIKSRKTAPQREKIVGPYCRRQSKSNDVDYYALLLHEERDTSTLELMQSFTRDAPQFALQLYILATRPTIAINDVLHIKTVNMQYISAVISLVTLSWSLVSFQRALRFSMEDKINLTVVGSFFLFLWRLCVIAARIVSLVLFATQFRNEFFIVFGIHWLVMIIWILLQRTNFCGSIDDKPRQVPELIYNVVMGWVYIFCYINVKDEPSRYKYLFYYFVTFCEDMTLVGLWYWKVGQNGAPWYHLHAVVGVPAGLVLGFGFMLVYYRFFHPSGRMPDTGKKATLF